MSSGDTEDIKNLKSLSNTFLFVSWRFEKGKSTALWISKSSAASRESPDLKKFSEGKKPDESKRRETDVNDLSLTTNALFFFFLKANYLHNFYI